MMKRFRPLYGILLSALVTLTACQGDSDDEQGGGQPAKGGLAQIHLRISPAGSQFASGSQTRADWTDNNATDDEMMNLWTVVVVEDASNKVVMVQSCRPSSPYAEIDDVATLESGVTYRFYSFANISAESLENILGISAGAVPRVPAGTTDVIQTITADTYTAPQGSNAANMGSITETGGNEATTAPIRQKTVSIEGNLFNPTADNNGFGEKGIPMSNVQTYTVSGMGKYDLIVIRMVAKVEMRFYNVSDKDLKVKSVTLSDVTQNVADNLLLLPNLTAESTTANQMEFTHKDIQPNVSATATRGDLTYTTTTGGLTVDKNTTTTSDNYKSVVFYINETAKLPAGKQFYLTVELDGDDYRYALINQKGASTDDDNAWDYIARNDYRIIPIVLDDYRLELIPYDFPAIGVLPSSSKEIDAAKHLYEMDFHDYGHFHLVPTVKHGTDVIDFSLTAPATAPTDAVWTLKGATDAAKAADWTSSFTSYTDATMATEYNAANAGTVALYGEANSLGEANYTTLTTYAYPNAIDASENGNFPVMDIKTNWNGCNTSTPTTQPFIFGQIAPHGKGSTATCYHEMRVWLYVKSTTNPRELIYRFYVNYSQDHATARRRVHSHDM